MKTHIQTKITKIIGFIIAIYLVYSFVIHGLSALFASPGMVGLVQQAGFPIAEILVRIVGIFDILIAIAIFTYRKKWVILYAGLWPLIPMILTGIVNGYWSIGYLQYPLLAMIMYLCLDWRKKT